MPSNEELEQLYDKHQQRTVAPSPKPDAALEELYEKHQQQALPMLTEPPKSAPKVQEAPFKFSWGRMAGNILPDLIRNIEDLKHLIKPESAKAVGNLIKELAAIGISRGRTKMPTPTLNAISDFYKTNYNITSSEGQKYIEEHPAQVASDLIAIATMAGAGLGKLGVNAPKLVNTLKASNHFAPKVARGAAQVIEGAVDPGAAIGRQVSKVAAFWKSKKSPAFTDGFDYLQKAQTLGKEKNITINDQILIDAWADGFEPKALQKHIDSRGVLIHDDLRQMLAGNTHIDLVDLGERLAKYTKPADFKRAIEIGKNRIKDFPGLFSMIGGGVTGLSGEWAYFVLGVAGDLFRSGPSGKVEIPQWVYKEPPGWAEKVKQYGINTGRGLQRGSRIKEERARGQNIIRDQGNPFLRYRNRNLQQ